MLIMHLYVPKGTCVHKLITRTSVVKKENLEVVLCFFFNFLFFILSTTQFR